MTPHSAARLRLLAAALLFSTGGAAIKAAAFTGWQIAGFRSGIAALAIWLLAPAVRRGWTRGTWAVGVAYAACLTLFVLANRLTTAANTIFLQSTAPLYLLVLGPWLLREPVRRQDLALMAVVAAGLGLFFVGSERPAVTAPDPLRGNLLALASGFFWALTVCGLRWLGAREGGAGPSGGESAGAMAAVVAGNLIAFLACLPLALPLGPHPPADWAVIVYLGLFQIGLAYVFMARALRAIPALEASVLLLIEPVLNPVWAWVVHGETPSPWALAGGAIILGATALKSRLESRETEPAAAEAVPPGAVSAVAPPARADR